MKKKTFSSLNKNVFWLQFQMVENMYIYMYLFSASISLLCFVCKSIRYVSTFHFILQPLSMFLIISLSIYHIYIYFSFILSIYSIYCLCTYMLYVSIYVNLSMHIKSIFISTFQIDKLQTKPKIMNEIFILFVYII